MFDVDRRRVLLSTVATTSTGTAVWAGSRLRASGTDEEPATNETSTTTADDGSTTTRQETADARETSDDDEDKQDEGEPTDPVEFLDCETICVTESADDVLVSLSWWDEQGLIGTIAEPVGAADGDRTISMTEEFGPFAHGPIVTEVELFETGTPVVPGGGDVLVSNPDAESCAESIREEHDESVDLEPVEF